MDIVHLPLALQFTSPGPILFKLGPLAVRWYGFLIASAVLIGVSLSQYLAKKRKVDPELIGDLAIWLVLAAIPCARLYYVAFQWENYAQNPASALAIWQGGIAIHGAILGGVLAGWIFGRIHRIPFWQLADLVAPSLILGQAIGRWGNFFNSEAFGAPTDLPWKLYIPPEIEVNGSIVRPRPPEFANVDYFHPTFLYESLWNLMVFTLLMNLFFRDLKGKPRLKVGTLFLVYVVAYSAGRIWIEGLRMDSLMLGPLRIAQLVSLSGMILGCLGLLWLYSKPHHSLIPKTLRASQPGTAYGALATTPQAPPTSLYLAQTNPPGHSNQNVNQNPSQNPNPSPNQNFNQTANQTPKSAPQPAISPNSETNFLPRLILGSIGIALALLFAVFFTNRGALMNPSPSLAPSPSPAVQVQPPTSPGSPTIQSPTPSPVAADSPGQTQLNQARVILQDVSASKLNQAIVQAQEIPPDDPAYPQAQQDIQRWSQGI